MFVDILSLIIRKFLIFFLKFVDNFYILSLMKILKYKFLISFGNSCKNIHQTNICLINKKVLTVQLLPETNFFELEKIKISITRAEII